jgi:hypothetical protein
MRLAEANLIILSKNKERFLKNSQDIADFTYKRGKENFLLKDFM